jgi:hypothetical protein
MRQWTPQSHLQEAFRKELFRLINQYLSFPDDATHGKIVRTLVTFQQAVDGDGPMCSQPRTCRQSLRNAVFLPWGQSFNFLFAACPDFVRAPCAWLLYTQLIDHDQRTVVSL